MENTKKDRKPVAVATVTLIAAALALYIVLHQNPLANQQEEAVKKIVSCGILGVVYLCFLKFYDRIMILPVELYQNRKLIWKLSKNDFKTRYAGSFFGIFWAFVQPVVTILVYWFVFDRGIKPTGSGPAEFSFVLWLTAGIVPWFFFSEALSGGTGALMEYNYLVKKVVFKISILPIIKIISAVFVHLFFIGFTILLYMFYGYYPDLYTLQVFYYSFCLFVFVLGLCYITCSVVIFFRDLSQIIGIALQIGIWATPIMWSLTTMDIPEKLKFIFKLNPLTYIVNGYRVAFIYKTWFWETDFYLTAYFWIVTIATFALGAVVFKRLKPHFADVL